MQVDLHILPPFLLKTLLERIHEHKPMSTLESFKTEIGKNLKREIMENKTKKTSYKGNLPPRETQNSLYTFPSNHLLTQNVQCIGQDSEDTW